MKKKISVKNTTRGKRPEIPSPKQHSSIAAVKNRVARFSVSLEKELLEVLDRHVKTRNYPTRSEALREMIRSSMVEKEWAANAVVAAVAIIVYDHHRSSVVEKLLEIQHDAGDVIISSQHIHLDHDNCLEIIAVRGPARRLDEFFGQIRSVKGVKRAALERATLGSRIP